MSTMTEYNGYTNKPTWLISLWIDNDQPSQEYVLEIAENCLINNDYDDEPNETTKQLAINDMADFLEELHSDQSHELLGPASVFTDMMMFVMSYVNWQEVAEGYIEQAIEEMEEV